MQKSLVPSLPASGWTQLHYLLESLKGVSGGFQVDIVDGKFVDAVSWPFTEDSVLSELMKLHDYKAVYDLEIDCMVNDPLQYLETLINVGATRIIVHYGGTEDWSAVFSHHQKHGYQLGLAFTNDVPLATIETLLPNFDYVQVMGIATVGAQGQPFDERTIETVTTLRAAHPELEIAIDGSVNQDTIPLLLEAGANRFAPGSAIAKAANPKEAYKQLSELI